MSKDFHKTKMFFRMSFTFLLTLLVAAQAWGAPGEGEPDEEREKRVERIVIAPDIQVRGLNPNIRWVGRSGGFLGIGLTELTPALREHFGVGSDRGVMISEIEEGSPAAAAGLRVGDIIVRAGETDVHGTGQLAMLVFKQENGALLDIEYWRDGRLEQTRATIEEREQPPGSLISFGGLKSLESLEGLKGLEQLERLENLQPEIMERVQKSLEEAFDGDWQARLEEQLEQIQEINVEKIEERMEELRERMEELEERLEERYGEGGSGNNV